MTNPAMKPPTASSAVTAMKLLGIRPSAKNGIEVPIAPSGISAGRIRWPEILPATKSPMPVEIPRSAINNAVLVAEISSNSL